jgi:hypothetical protein
MTQDNTRDAFTRYAELAFSALNKSESDKRSCVLRVIKKREDIREKATEIEQKEAFYQLVTETRIAYGKGYHKCGEEKSKSHREIWAGAIRNFFRRSGFYLSCSDGIPYDSEEIFDLYCQSFSRKEMRITYLAPISSVELDYREQQVLRFDAFSIRQLSDEDKKRWEAKNRVNEVFYPTAAIDLEEAFDKRLLSNYSFLKKVVASPIPRLVIDNDFFPWAEMEKHRIVFSHHHEIEVVLKRMVLFDWESQFFDTREFIKPLAT